MASMFSGDAVPAAEDIGLIASDIRRSERLIRVAIQTVDKDELAAQRRKLLANFPRINNVAQADVTQRLSCSLANQTLLNIISDLSLPPARAVVAVEDDDREYRKYITHCERAASRGKR
jgi:hypothetical protein